MLKIHKNNYLILIFSVLMTTFPIYFNGCAEGSDPSGNTSDDTSGETTIDLSNATIITLNGDSITVDGDGVSVIGTIATITSSGTYSISGTLNDGQVKVAAADAGDIYLYLNNTNITSFNASPLDIESAEKTIIYLADNTQNYLTDGVSNTTVDEDGEAIDAALFSKDDLLFAGNGSLTVNANNNNGIKSKDGLIIERGIINVTSVDDGIIGKNYIVVEDGEISIDAEGDGLKSTEDDDATQGYISIEGGIIDITAGADAIQAETDIVVNAGEFMLNSGGGSEAPLASDATAKGIKAPVSITINGGVFTIDSADDAIHSNESIEINSGAFSISSGDDGIHADTEIEINDGEISIQEAYEGIESLTITINGGEIHVLSDDDPINATDGSGSMTSHLGYLYINGGYVALNCGHADGLDSNGTIVMTNGLVIINGPVSGGNGILDYGSFTMSCGTIVGAGTSDMAQAPGSNDSAQYSLLLIFNQQTAGTLFHIETSSGADIVTFAPAKAYASIVFSSPELTIGNYVYNIGGTYTGGTVKDGLYDGGTYSGGIDTGFTISSKVTTIGGGGGHP